MAALAGVLCERQRILEQGVLHEGAEPLPPIGHQGVEVDVRVVLGAPGHRRQPHGIVVVIAGEQFVGGGAGNRHLVALVADGFGKERMDVVADGRHRRVVVGDQRLQAGDKTLARGMHGVMFAAEPFDHGGDVFAFVVAGILVDDGKTMDVMA